MNNVYLVVEGRGDPINKAMFSTKASAEEYAASLRKVIYDTIHVEEYALDEVQPIKSIQFWEAAIDLKSGEIQDIGTWYVECKDPGNGKELGAYTYSLNKPCLSSRLGINLLPISQMVTSYCSAEHARQIAVHARQKFLETYDINLVKQHNNSSFWLYEGDLSGN